MIIIMPNAVVFFIHGQNVVDNFPKGPENLLHHNGTPVHKASSMKM